MSETSLVTQHARTSVFHFLRGEAFVSIIMVSFISFVFVIPIVIDEDVHFFNKLFSSIFSIVASYPFYLAFLRARFIREGGYCIITSEVIQSVYNGRTRIYEYKGRSIKTRTRKNGSKDIYIGRSLIDLIKFGIGREYFKTMAAGLGLGAPLYNVVNADEVLEYIKQHD